MGLYTDVRTALRKTAIAALIDYFPTVDSQNKGIIFSHIDGSEPVGDYVIINILNITQQGHHMNGSLLSSGKLQVSAAYEVQAQFSFVGTGSGDISHSFNQRISNNPLTLQEASRNKLGVMRKSSVRRAPQKRDTKWVDYHNTDVTFSYIASGQQTIDSVDTVVVNDVVDDVVFTIPPGVVLP